MYIYLQQQPALEGHVLFLDKARPIFYELKSSSYTQTKTHLTTSYEQVRTTKILGGKLYFVSDFFKNIVKACILDFIIFYCITGMNYRGMISATKVETNCFKRRQC